MSSQSVNAEDSIVISTHVTTGVSANCPAYGKKVYACITGERSVNKFRPDDFLTAVPRWFKYNDDVQKWELIGDQGTYFEEGRYKMSIHVTYQPSTRDEYLDDFDTAVYDSTNPSILYSRLDKDQFYNTRNLVMFSVDKLSGSSQGFYYSDQEVVVTKDENSETIGYEFDSLRVNAPNTIKVGDKISDFFNTEFSDSEIYSLTTFAIAKVDRETMSPIAMYGNIPGANPEELKNAVFEKGYYYMLVTLFRLNYYDMEDSNIEFTAENIVQIQDLNQYGHKTYEVLASSIFDTGVDFNISDIDNVTERRAKELSISTDINLSDSSKLYINDEEYIVNEDVLVNGQSFVLLDAGLAKINQLAIGDYDVRVEVETGLIYSGVDLRHYVYSTGSLTIVPYDYSYEFIEGDNQEFEYSKVSGFKFRVDGDYNLFDSLFIGGEELIRDEDYVVSEGSTTIELTESGLNRLNEFDADTYEIEVNYSNGKQAKGTLIISEAITNETIVEEVTPIEVPFTFDNAMMWFALGAVSLLGIGGTIIFTKKLN